MADRANIFDFEVTDFTPEAPKPAPPKEAIKTVAEKASFQSREPEKSEKGRERRIYRTGRNAQFSCKADPEVIAEFYSITESQGWVMGQTLENAVAALKKSLSS